MAEGFRIYRGLNEIGADFGPCALTIGNFDGVHLGHRELLRRVTQLAGANGWNAAVLTFHPHPATVVAPERAPKLLSSPEQRAEWMRDAGIGQVVILPFDLAFSQLSPEDFVDRVVAGKLGAKAVLVGENFRFGNGQTGDTQVLRELGRRYGFAAEVVPGVRLRGRMVSSSEVRRLLESGSVAMAARLLGRPYAIEGVVVPGYGIGRSLTVPTLNLRSEAQILPRAGVYVTRTYDLDSQRRWPSVTNVGMRPTFSGDTLTIETYILEGYSDPAPNRLRLEFLFRIRAERRFPDPAALKARIERDARLARAWFRRVRAWVKRAE